MPSSVLMSIDDGADGFVGAHPAAPPGASAGADAAGIRTAEFEETIERAGPALMVPIALAWVLVPFFWTTPQRLLIIGAVGGLCIIGLGVLLLRRAAKGRRVPAAAGQRLATALALLVGVAWATLPILLYPSADPTQRLVIVATLAGTIGNVSLLGSAWPVGLAYVLPLLAGGIFGFSAGSDPASITLAVLLFGAGAVIGTVLDRNRKQVSGRILARREVDEHAFTIERLLLDFEETNHEWLWETDARARFRGVAERMADAAGLAERDLEGKPFRSILRVAPASPAAGDGTEAVLEAMRTRQPFRNRIVAVQTPHGGVWWRLSARPIHDAAGQFIGYRGIGSDITAAREADARIAYLANHDACTGLPNRVSFHAHAQRECIAAAQGGRGGALLSLDLDGFKAVNDRLGHAAGDEVLKEVARRLTALVPIDAMVARLGGDEFAIWCPSAVPAKATAIADSVIETVSVPVTLLDGAEIRIGASVGIALTPKHATDPDLLLVRGDLALYQAKADGKGLCRIFVDDYERSLVEKRSLEADLRLALARQEFLLHYQPIVDVGSGQVVCFETLIRWKSPTRGFVSPADFIPAAESAGLIVAIDRWVLQRACKDATSWPDDIHVAVNVSPHHFRSASLVQDVQLALRLSGLDPHRLDIEVTEGVFLDKSSTAVETLQMLRRLGILIALDDFGTGYSSLSYLINFPIDKIKIDRAFVRDFVDRHESRAIVDAILTLARKLSMKVVAEGVETAEQALALKLRRCDQIQGYLLDRPQPGPDVEMMLMQAPERYRDAVPTHVDSALGMALAMKKQAI